MHRSETGLIFTATDLSAFLACPHLTLLNLRTALGGPKPPVYDDPSLEVLRRRGEEHERAYLQQLRVSPSTRVTEIVDASAPDNAPMRARWTRLASATLDAMRDGADAIYQATPFDGTWLGRVDFLVRKDTPSNLGAWSYEVADTKLAREAKGGALLQVLLYTDLLASVQGVSPVRVQLALGGPETRTEHFRVADYAAYFRSVRQRFLQHVADAPAAVPLAVEPVEHCTICAWSEPCKLERRDVDHLSFVAGITRSQRAAFVAGDIRTLKQLG